MTSIKSSHSFVLEDPPSCIAFSPTHPEFFVIGTYLLHPKTGNEDAEDNAPQKRSGSLLLYRLDNGECKHISTTSTPDYSILDIKWSPHTTAPGKDLLAVATSTGLLELYHFSIDPTRPLLEHYTTHKITSPDILILYLTWHDTLPDILGLTLSNGTVQLLQSTPHNPDSPSSPWNPTCSTLTQSTIYTHTLEAWSLSFLPSPSPPLLTLLSGADDLTLQESTCSSPLLPSPSQAENPPTFLSRKLHSAGITFILPLPSPSSELQDLVLTGSYDDHIRLIRLPPSKSPGGKRIGRAQVLAEENLEGGVWRLQVLPSSECNREAGSVGGGRGREERWTILASCMHAGTRVVELVRSRGAEGEEEKWGFGVVGRFEEHESMNYGSGVLVERDGGRSKRTVVSTSFYDRLVCVWEV